MDRDGFRRSSFAELDLQKEKDTNRKTRDQESKRKTEIDKESVTSVDVKSVEESAGSDAPEFDAKVGAAGQRVRRIVPIRIVERVEKGCHFPAMAFGSEVEVE